MTMKIESYDYSGRGITHLNNKVYFITKGLQDEEIEWEVVKEDKHCGYAYPKKILNESSIRVPSFCPYGLSCTGCTLDIVKYEDSLKIKEMGINDLLNKNNIDINFPIVTNKDYLGYRNKLSLHVKGGEFGFLREYTHDFVPIKNCLIANPCIQNVLKDFRMYSFLEGNLTIRCNNNNEILLIIETEEELNVSSKLMGDHKIVGIVLNNKCIYGEPFLYEMRDNLVYKISYDAFFQVNPYMSEQIAKEVMSFINKDDVILDLYCGSGFFTFKMAKYAKEVVGVEINQNAVLDGIKMAKVNKLNNVSFHLGKVENIISHIPQCFTKVLVDPPRSGLDKKTIDFLLDGNYQTIIYVSCNPLTLVRDIKRLSEKYDIGFLKGYDMFSFTKHVECLCVLNSRQSFINTKKINYTFGL